MLDCGCHPILDFRLIPQINLANCILLEISSHLILPQATLLHC
ncbi:hypothetical protein GXM_08174 [Nostoc sphaeroides CCNUC1]|uniref:Uncharacterized protein n=1 Tax=Nostoc sphaeroides CCNUC1 TaxID=2653204 RepID=A0A5P8WDI8_9NOSO|nr:hypothetical protein GXM_08174 [Nostoc sphaeroides CCNUC1]